MSRPMNFDEFRTLLDHIYKEHHPFDYDKKGGKPVKYVDPHIDMRFGNVFAVTFRGFGWGEHTLHTQNKCRDLPDTLFDRCIAFLNESVEVFLAKKRDS